MQAQNDDGTSRWSDEVSYCTAVERPGAPSRPSVKGKMHAHSFRLRWEPPADPGGSPITDYSVEMDAGDQGFTPLWNGSETECACDRLKPGTTYRLRVSCANSGGRGPFSDACTVSTESVCPAQCPAPHAIGRAKANSLQLKWGTTTCFKRHHHHLRCDAELSN